MALEVAYSGSVTVDTTEVSLISGNTTPQSVSGAGVFTAVLGLQNLTATDIVQLRVYERVLPGAPQRLLESPRTFSGLEPEHRMTVPLTLRHGYDFRLVKIAGANRAIDYRIEKMS